jgi:hypothetical protein
MPEIRERHSFTLILPGVDENTSGFEKKLFEAGCDDATLGIHAGTPYLAFDREADSRGEAIISAIRDVKKSGLSIEVIWVVPEGEETISWINAHRKRCP